MSLESVLKTYGQIGLNVLKNAVAPHDATGRTRASIRFESDKEGLRFYAREYFELLEKGIKPTKKEPIPSREMIEMLTEYGKARGKSNPKKFAWGVAKKILKEGDLTHNRGGRIVYSDVMEQFQKQLGAELTKDYGKEINLQIKGYFK